MGLTVQTLKTKDEDRGIVALNAATLEATDYSNGDYVAVCGPDGQTLARVWEGYPNDDAGTIRMDAQLRDRIGTEVGSEVELEGIDVVPAGEIVITVDDVDVPGNPRNIIRRELTHWAVTPGRTVEFSASSGPLGAVSDDSVLVSVEETTPDKTVVVTADTDIEISGTPEPARDATDGPGRPRQSPGVKRVSETPSDDEEKSDTNAPDTTFEEIGGLADEVESVQELVELPLGRPEVFDQLGIDRPNGILLHGPPGTGKTMLARAAANEIDAHFASIAAPEIVSEYYGRSEEQLREVFEEAEENSPGIVFVDEIDAIAQSRGEASDGVESRIVAQLLSLMDGLEDRAGVIVVATTNRVDDLDPALRRGGRFDYEIEITIPDRNSRKEILDIHVDDMPLGSNVDTDDLAGVTHGFVGADLELLVQSAGMSALRRVRDEGGDEQDETTRVENWSFPDETAVTSGDFNSVIGDIDPAGMRELAVSVPNTSWDDVGGLEQVKDRMKEAVQWPLAYPDAFEELDLSSGTGVLLYGPPGTGKTLLARAVASEAESNFISVRGPEILDRFVGESEEAIRRIFERARENSPTVVFFDEFDALAVERNGDSADGGVVERVVSQLLTEIDGLETNSEVVVIATSNRPDLLDPALLRSGRFEQNVRVPIPAEAARREIFDIHTRNRTLASEVDLDELAARTENYVGADIESVCRTAAFSALRESVSNDADELDPSSIVIEGDHFEQAMDEVSPSVTEEMRDGYDQLEASLDAEDDDDPKGFY